MRSFIRSPSRSSNSYFLLILEESILPMKPLLPVNRIFFILLLLKDKYSNLCVYCKNNLFLSNDFRLF